MWSARRALAVVAWTVLVFGGLASGLAAHRLWQLRSEIERLADQLTLDAGPQSTLLFDSGDELVSAVFEEHRIAVPLEDMSPHLTGAVLVTEDRRFFEHDGFDVRRIVAAFIANQRAGGIVEGGSTITQQLVRAIILDRSRTYGRKAREALLAMRLEERYSKHDILEAYLNRVYFGDGYYGVGAAALGYFGKQVGELDVAEAATLAGLIKGPSLYSPTRNPDACRKRRDLVLLEMHASGALDEQRLDDALAVPVKALLARRDAKAVPDPRHARGAEYFRAAVTRELVEKFGEELVYTGGLRVYTTLDRARQQLAEKVVASQLHAIDKGLQGALVAIDPRTGFVQAIVGGSDFSTTQYNRATEARRQPGSAFKPFIYAVALESGYSPASLIERLDEPIPTREGPWLPRGEHELSSTTLRSGLALSSNRAAAHLLQQVGVLRTLDLAQRLGISSPLPAVPALALGTGEVSLYELTAAYSAFANRGVWRSPTMIRRVEDRYGRQIYAATTTERTVLSEATAYMMASMMTDVVRYGSAASARAQGVNFRAAGKTGTSHDYSDAWFVGFTPALVTGVWFGFDKPRPIMDRGFASVVAVPAWARFMTAALGDAPDEWPDMPGSLVKVRICKLSGGAATEHCNEPIYEPAPYDTDPFEIGGPYATIKASAIYEEVMPADRVPPPCTLPHGVTAYAPLVDPYADPSASVAPVERAGGLAPDPAPAERPARPMIQPSIPDPARPVTPPPPFMMERPSPPVTIVGPEPRPIIPPSETTMAQPVPPPDPYAPIVPGARSKPIPPPRRPPG